MPEVNVLYAGKVETPASSYMNPLWVQQHATSLLVVPSPDGVRTQLLLIDKHRCPIAQIEVLTRDLKEALG